MDQIYMFLEAKYYFNATIPMLVANIVLMLAPRTLFPHFMYTWAEAYKA